MSIRWAVNTLLDYAKAEEVDQDLADQLATALQNVLLALAQRCAYTSQLMNMYNKAIERLDARENEL